MVIERGDVWWADLGHPRGSEPGYRRPLLVVQSEAFNRSRISTVLCATITSNLALRNAPGNVLLPANDGSLPKDSVVNVSQVVTVDRSFLKSRVGSVSPTVMAEVGTGLRLVLGL